MKRNFFALIGLLLALALTLTACGGKGPAPFDPADTARALNGGGAFSEELEELERDIFVRWYGLDESGLTGGVVYASTGLTAEELAVLTFTDEEAAKAGEEALRRHIDDQIEANEDYRPQEIPKLKDAVVERRGNSVLAVVADDYAAVRSALGK